MKRFFNLSDTYHFEWNDIRALCTLANVLGIICFGMVACYLGLAIAAFGFIKDLSNKNRHINEMLMHLATITLNVYLLAQFY